MLMNKPCEKKRLKRKWASYVSFHYNQYYEKLHIYLFVLLKCTYIYINYQQKYSRKNINKRHIWYNLPQFQGTNLLKLEDVNHTNCLNKRFSYCEKHDTKYSMENMKLVIL